MRLFVPAIFLVLGALTACTTMAPAYQPDYDNTLALKRMSGKVKVGEFLIPEEKRDIINNVSLRGTQLQSPYHDSFAEYVRQALKKELEDAGRYGENEELEVAGVLLENSYNASGFSKGTGRMSARFLVRKGTAVRYDEVTTVEHEWPSAFAGAIAIPAARDNYPVMVQKLIKKLVSDPKFSAALKQK